MANDRKVLNNSYDEVPYVSFPFSQSDPAKLKSIAFLFGLDSPDLENARILEIGCASGNNIMSIATKYPNSTCIGIDLSSVQIEQGNKIIKELGIKNLKLKKESILSFKGSNKKFDYIICHGVFSWVSKLVQNKIMEICSSHLTANGVAYISYNTLPGWNSIKSLREMMLFHTQHFSSPAEKASQARLMLQFILASSKAQNKTFYSDIIENEIALLNNQSDWYLLHDHLEENNTPYYFHQFVDMAAKYKLQYLSETDLASMFIGNLPQETAKILETSNDIIRSEQYIDFITNRRFRTTLLCHKDYKLQRTLNINMINDKYFTTTFKTEDNLSEYNFAHGKTISFSTPSNINFTTSDAEIIAAISILMQQGQKPISMDSLCKCIIEKLKQQAIPVKEFADLKDFIALHFMRNIFTGGIILHLDEGKHNNVVSKKPKAFFLAIYQAQNQDWVTSLLHENIWITEFDKALLTMLNGNNDVSTIVSNLSTEFKNRNLSMHIEREKIDDLKVISEKLPEIVNNTLKRYANLALLIS